MDAGGVNHLRWGRRRLRGRSGVIPTAGGDEHDAEVGSDGEGAREEVEDNVGRGRGGYVVVAWFTSEEQVADILASHARGDVQHATAVRLGITDSLVSRTIKRARR